VCRQISIDDQPEGKEKRKGMKRNSIKKKQREKTALKKETLKKRIEKRVMVFSVPNWSTAKNMQSRKRRQRERR
jgi:hypothetical protein